MADLEQRPKIAVEVTLRLTEAEARALHAIGVYGTRSFLEMFYKHLGVSYLRPHEAGLLSLFEGVREHLPPILNRAKEARKAFVVSLEPKIMNQHTQPVSP